MDKKIKDTRVEAHRQREGRDKKEKINTPKGGKQNHKSQEEKKMFADRREHYQSLFFLLHANPRYLASLARAVAMAKSHTLVQTIVMDVYGDQYSPREERLLLTLFREVIRHEVAHSTSGSFMRSNTCLTQMLTAYARRGAGMSILKEVHYVCFFLLLLIYLFSLCFSYSRCDNMIFVICNNLVIMYVCMWVWCCCCYCD